MPVTTTMIRPQIILLGVRGFSVDDDERRSMLQRAVDDTPGEPGDPRCVAWFDGPLIWIHDPEPSSPWVWLVTSLSDEDNAPAGWLVSPIDRPLHKRLLAGEVAVRDAQLGVAGLVWIKSVHPGPMSAIFADSDDTLLDDMLVHPDCYFDGHAALEQVEWVEPESPEEDQAG